jgi:lipoprotein-anchoring transpeptidase ErfK/SrfK
MRLVINRHTLRATLFRRGKRIFRAPVGVGTPSTPTPGGHFWVREKFRVRAAGHSIYGPYAFGTAAYAVLSDWPGGGVVGIHGTGQPGLVPGRPSHGCIRMHNWDIRRLFRLMPRGTPIRIL